jgi:hypothetical protein
MNYRNIALCAVSLSAALLVTTIRAAEKPKYLFWASAQMADLDKKLTSSMDGTKGSRVDMMPTDHSFFMVTHREGNSPSGEVHQKYGDFAVVRSGEGGILAGGKLVASKQSAPNELRGKIEAERCTVVRVSAPPPPRALPRDRDAPAHTPIIASRCSFHTRIDGGK